MHRQAEKCIIRVGTWMTLVLLFENVHCLGRTKKWSGSSTNQTTQRQCITHDCPARTSAPNRPSASTFPAFKAGTEVGRHPPCSLPFRHGFQHCRPAVKPERRMGGVSLSLCCAR